MNLDRDIIKLVIRNHTGLRQVAGRPLPGGPYPGWPTNRPLVIKLVIRNHTGLRQVAGRPSRDGGGGVCGVIAVVVRVAVVLVVAAGKRFPPEHTYDKMSLV